MNPNLNLAPVTKFRLSPELIHRYRRTSTHLVEKMENFDKLYTTTEMIIYERAKKVLQAVIGKLEIVISFGVCEFEWMDDVHKSILDFNECTDKYEDILQEIDLLPKDKPEKR